MKCHNCPNFVTAHAFLTGWHLFTFFTAQLFLPTPSVKLDFCFILVASNTVIWASLFGAHMFKLEVEDFVFHAVVFSRETFQTLAWKFLLCVPQKVFGVYIFPKFVFVQYIVVQKLVKTKPKTHKYFLSFSICRWHVIVQTYRNKKLNILITTCQSKEKNTNQIYLNSNALK